MTNTNHVLRPFTYFLVLFRRMQLDENFKPATDFSEIHG